MPKTTSTSAFYSLGYSELAYSGSQCRYHLSKSHVISEGCKTIGFGTCIKDIDYEYPSCGPSPMDQLLAEVERVSLGPTFQESLPNADNYDVPSLEGFPYDASSLSETTISTPNPPPEDGVHDFSGACCPKSWLPYNIPTSDNIYQHPNLLNSTGSFNLGSSLPQYLGPDELALNLIPSDWCIQGGTGGAGGEHCVPSISRSWCHHVV